MIRLLGRFALLCLAILCCIPVDAAASSPAYRIDMELNPAAPFPFLSKFGKIDLSIYPGGVHGETMLLEGYSRNHASTLTVLSPYSRIYADVPISDLQHLVLSLSGSRTEVVSGLGNLPIAPPVKGAVRGVPATRYRVILGKDAWLDVWTTNSVPKNPQFHALQMQFLGAISQAAARTAASIPGMPLYVELKTRRFNKVPILRLKQIVRSRDGEDDALSTGSFYMRSPIVQFFLK